MTCGVTRWRRSGGRAPTCSFGSVRWSFAMSCEKSTPRSPTQWTCLSICTRSGCSMKAKINGLRKSWISTRSSITSSIWSGTNLLWSERRLAEACLLSTRQTTWTWPSMRLKSAWLIQFWCAKHSSMTFRRSTSNLLFRRWELSSYSKLINMLSNNPP